MFSNICREKFFVLMFDGVTEPLSGATRVECEWLVSFSVGFKLTATSPPLQILLSLFPKINDKLRTEADLGFATL